MRTSTSTIILFMLFPLASMAAPQTFELTIENHQFQPRELHIPAGVKIRLNVINKDKTPEEFESYELNREKVVGGNSSIRVFIGPLDAGSYPFFGEFHADTARGVLIAE